MDSGKGQINEVEYSPQVALTEKGVVVKNRAYRRRFLNRAMMEGRSSKKYYTTKRTKCRRKRG